MAARRPVGQAGDPPRQRPDRHVRGRRRASPLAEAGLGGELGESTVPLAQFEVTQGGRPPVNTTAGPRCRCSPTSSPASDEDGKPHEAAGRDQLLSPPGGRPKTNGLFGVVEVLGTPDGSLYYRVFGRGEDGQARGEVRSKSGRSTKGKEIVAFGATNETMTIAFQVEDYLPRAREGDLRADRPAQGPDGQRHPRQPRRDDRHDPDDTSKELTRILRPPVGHARPALAARHVPEAASTRSPSTPTARTSASS